MKKEQKINNISVRYKNSIESKERFIGLLIDYFLEKEIYRKADNNEISRKKNQSD